MGANELLNRTLLLMILCLCVVANQECGLALVDSRPGTEVRTEGWLKDDDGSFSGMGASRAGYNESCGEEDFNLSFKLRKLRGEMHVNFNINGSNHYSIGFANRSSLTEIPVVVAFVPPTDYMISTFISKHAGGATPSIVHGNATQYIPNQEYQISINSSKGHIQVYVERIETTHISVLGPVMVREPVDAPMDEAPADAPIETELTAAEEAPASEMIVARMPAIQPVIDYYDPKPLPPGVIDFETLEGAYVEIYDVILTCMPNQLPTVTSLIQDPTSLMVNRQVGWTASAYDPEGDDIYYSFWLIGPSTDGWKLQQNWSTHNRCEWRPSQAGFYRIGVYAGDDNHTPEDICDSNVSWIDDVVYVEQEPPKLGYINFQRPDPDSLINVRGTVWGFNWGLVPKNHVLIVVDDNRTLEEANEVAYQLASDRNLNGTVVGKFDYIKMFQIKTDSNSREELEEDIAYARNFSGVRLAFPNQLMYRESSGDDLSPSYEVVGVQNAWEIMESYHDDPLNFGSFDVIVGITDDGIYNWSGCEEFNHVCINASLSESFGPAWLSTYLENYSISGSHGTGIMNILAADPDHVGLTGIASKALGEKLKIYIINIFPQYPEFPGGLDFTTESLKALHYEITNGSTILSCSWGTGNPDPQMAEMYGQFFYSISKHPNCSKILFVCSAGNDGRDFSAESYTHVPGGMKYLGNDMSNMISVGNIMNDRSIAPNSNKESYRFEVTIAAPGEEAFWGRNSNGSIQKMGGGTSMATPHVTAAAAMIRSINPKLTAEQIKGILKESAINDILSINSSLELTIREYLPSEKIMYQEPPTSDDLPPINSSGSNGTIRQEDEPTVTNWILELWMIELWKSDDTIGTAKELLLELGQKGASVSGRGVLEVASEDRDNRFNPTSSQLPVEASGSYDGTNLALTISLNDNVRYELELTQSKTTGSPERGIYGIYGPYESYDSRGVRSRGDCTGLIKPNPQATATSDSRNEAVRYGSMEPEYSIGI